MKRYSLLFSILALITISSGWCFAAYPSLHSGILDGVGDTTATFQMYQGWFCGQPTWFIRTATNDIRFAQTQNMTLVPKLNSAVNNGAAQVFIVTNYDQGPVFSTIPGDRCYSGLWQVYYVTWQSGFEPRPINNAECASPQNPYGMPKCGVKICCTKVVVDYPIVAVGQLGGPWASVGSNAWTGGDFPVYRIQQGITYNAYSKKITLPAWYAFCQNERNQQIQVAKVIITDVSDESLAQVLKANYAPKLCSVPKCDTQAFFIFSGPRPPNQLPVLDFCPDSLDWRNTYYKYGYNYSPVMAHVLLYRKIAQSTIVDDPDYVYDLLARCRLVVINSKPRINANVVGFLQ